MAGESGDTGKRMDDAKKAILAAESKRAPAFDPTPPNADPPDKGTAGTASSDNKKEGLVDFVAKPYKIWWGYIQTGYRDFYIKLLKINFTALFAYWLILLIVFGLPLGAYLLANGTGAISGILANVGLLIFLVILLFAAIIIAAWIRSTIVLSAISLAAAELEKKPFSLGESFGRLKWPILRLVVIESAINLLLALPLIVIMLLFFGGVIASIAATATHPGAAPAGILALIFGMIFAIFIAIAYLFVVFSIYGFIVQFWAFGIVIEGRGVIDSLKRSYALVKANFWETIVFDIATWIGAIVFAIPAGIVSFIFNLTQRLLPLFFSSSTAAYWGAYIGIVAVSALVGVFFTTIVQLFVIPCNYLYWKQLSEKK